MLSSVRELSGRSLTQLMHPLPLTGFEEERILVLLQFLEELMQLSPEHQLIGLIDTVIFENEFLTWRGTAADLETALRESKYSREADRLFRFNTACGVYLARLHEQDPERFKKTKSKGKVTWAVSPPNSTVPGMPP